MNRGILATCYARPTGADAPPTALLDLLRAAYADEPFVVVLEGSPSTKATLGSNTAHVTARYDERTGSVVAIAAIDNLTKGASGAGRAVRQPAPRPPRDHRPPDRGGLPVSVTGAGGVQPPAASRAASRRRATST